MTDRDEATHRRRRGPVGVSRLAPDEAEMAPANVGVRPIRSLPAWEAEEGHTLRPYLEVVM